MQIRKNLYLVSGGTYGILANVCAITYQGGTVLIDCGKPESFDTIINILSYWGINKDSVTHVILTHGHDDHAGTAKAFQQLGAKIIVGQEDAYMLEQGNFGKESPFQNHQMPQCKPDLLIDQDTTLEIGNLSFKLYKVPGHTNGSLLIDVKLNDEEVLFTGDMFRIEGEKGDLAYTGWKGDMDYDVQKLGESFKKLWSLNLNPNVIVGGHGIPRIGAEAKDLIMIAYKYYLLENR